MGFKAVESARSHLSKLVEAGRLTKADGQARGYGLPGRVGDRSARVPLLGRVQAGALTEALETPDGWVITWARPGATLFALRVRGESMSGVGIMPDDVVIVRRQPRAEEGDVVVAMVEGEATVKTLRFVDGGVVLHAENPAFAPIIPAADALTLLGKVVEVRRFLDLDWLPAWPS